MESQKEKINTLNLLTKKRERMQKIFNIAIANYELKSIKLNSIWINKITNLKARYNPRTLCKTTKKNTKKYFGQPFGSSKSGKSKLTENT